MLLWPRLGPSLVHFCGDKDHHYDERLTSDVLGEGSKQDATSHLIGVRFPEGGFMPCEDDEDLCDPGSGSGPGGHGVFPESNSLDSKSSVIEVGNDHLYSFTSTFLFPHQVIHFIPFHI